MKQLSTLDQTIGLHATLCPYSQALRSRIVRLGQNMRKSMFKLTLEMVHRVKRHSLDGIIGSPRRYQCFSKIEPVPKTARLPRSGQALKKAGYSNIIAVDLLGWTNYPSQ